jgi:D-amino-acid oxidase
MKRVAVVGAGVSGLTCAVLFAEQGYGTAIFAEETGQRTTSAAAGAIWYPYDVEPFASAVLWSLDTYKTLRLLAKTPATGVSMIELRTFSRTGPIQIPDWAKKLGARALDLSDTGDEREKSPAIPPKTFASGFRIEVPLTDTTVYLDYLADRFLAHGGSINECARFETLEGVPSDFEIVINCSGIGAKDLVGDPDLEPHRGQVAIVRALNLPYAVVCDDAPLMYAIPRTSDCLFGGTNEQSENRDVDPATTKQIVDECSRVLGIDKPELLNARVGLRPFRRSGIRLQATRLKDGRAAIHNYGHGGAGFTLSWGCAERVVQLANRKGRGD